MSNFQGYPSLISPLEIDPESCSDHFGGVEGDFDWFFCRFCVDFFDFMIFRERWASPQQAAWPPGCLAIPQACQGPRGVA